MKTLELERASGVLSITMNRPQKKNAVDGQMFRELAEALAEAARREDGPPLSLSLTKALLDESSAVSMAEALEHEAQAQAICLGSDDGRESIAAFLEKREPRYSGR